MTPRAADDHDPDIEDVDAAAVDAMIEQVLARAPRHYIFDPAVRRAGLEPLTPHNLRDTAASLAVASGANVKAVQRMLGHASAAMTLDVYSGLFDADLDAVAARMDLSASPTLQEWAHRRATGQGERPDEALRD